MAKNAANEEQLGHIHEKFTQLLSDHLDSCIELNELPENQTLNVIKSFLNDNKIYATEIVHDLEGRTARIIEMKKQNKRSAQEHHAPIAEGGN